MVDACLSRQTGLLVRDTDRTLARLVGGVVLTTDPSDIARLAANYPNVHVETLNPGPR